MVVHGTELKETRIVLTPIESKNLQIPKVGQTLQKSRIKRFMKKSRYKREERKMLGLVYLQSRKQWRGIQRLIDK